MKKSRFTESQICAILKEAEGGVSVADVCRKHGVSQASFYKWRSKFGGMDASLIKRMKELEAENQRLKKMYADSQMDCDILREVIEKKL
jgi:putative transposase